MPNELTALKAAVEALPASEDWHGTCDAEDAICKLITAARACVDAGKLEFTGSPSLWHGDNFTMIRIDRVLTDDEVAGVCRVLDAGDADAALLKALGDWVAARKMVRQSWEDGRATSDALCEHLQETAEVLEAAFQAAIGGE